MNKLDVRNAWRFYRDLRACGLPVADARAIVLPQLRRNREKFASMGGQI